MADFETHPAGTADLVKRLRSNTPNMAIGHAAMRHAADRIEHLEAALTRANAATAAAYEVAAGAAHEEAWPEDGTYGPEEREIEDAERATVTVIKAAIRALATADHTAALDRMIAEAVDSAAETAAQFVHKRLYEANMPACSYHSREIKAAILAASKKGGV